MSAYDAGRADVRLDLQVLAAGNGPLPDAFALNYLRFTQEFPDFERAISEQSGPFGMHIPRFSIVRDNGESWREYREYMRLHDGLIQMQFVLRNVSDTQLSNAKLEVTVEPLDGQGFQMLDGDDVRPEVTHWRPK